MGYSNKLCISSSKFRLLHIILMIPFAFSILDGELAYNCSGRYAAESSYSWSLSYLTEDLRVNTHLKYYKGFRSASWAQDNDWVYGLALCRGDVSPSDCENCVGNATITDLNKHCPYSRKAVIVRQLCLFKYSDVEFRGEIDYEIYYASVWPDNGQNTTLGEEAVGMLRGLSETAVGAAADKLFANATTLVGTNEILNGSVQCTRDLSAPDCMKCLNNVTSGIIGLSVDVRIALVVTGSCSVQLISSTR